MFFVILFLAVLILYFLIRYTRSSYALVFSLETLSIALLLFTNIMYTLRINKWNDLTLYNIFSGIHLSVYDTRIPLNLAIVLFLLSSTILFSYDLKSRRHYRKRLSGTIIGFVLSSAFLLYINAPTTVEIFYLWRYRKGHPELTLSLHFLRLLDFLLLFSCFLPCLKFMIHMLRTRIFFKRRHLGTLLILHTAFFCIFLSILLLMPVRSILFDFVLYDFSLSDWMETIIDINWYFSIGILLFAILFVLFFNFNVLNEKLYAKVRQPDDCTILTTDIRHIFHSYKNTLFSIQFQTQKALACYGTPESVEILNQVCANAESFLQKAGRFLDIYNSLVPQFDTVDIVSCVDSACAHDFVPGQIQIEKQTDTGNLTFYGDRDLMTEVFVNLISNASESLQNAKRPDGNILIRIWSENPWLCVSVRDNGLGIRRRNRKKIFDPLFSTKKSMNNWGIGLCYAQKIVLAHSGYINVKSRPNEYAEFQVTLPLDTDH